VGVCAFCLSAAEADQDGFELLGFGRGVGLQLPYHDASHCGHEESAGDGCSRFLLPAFQLVAVGFEQFEEAFNAPPPVVAPRQMFGRSPIRGSIAQQQPVRQCLALRIAQFHHDESKPQGTARSFEFLPADVFLGRPVEHDVGFRDAKLGFLSLMRGLPHRLKRLRFPQFPAYFAEQAGDARVPHAPIVGTDQEKVPRRIPAAVVVHRIRLAVDDVQQRLRQAPVAAGVHRGQYLFQVRTIFRPGTPSAEHARRRLQVHLHRRQRGSHCPR